MENTHTIDDERRAALDALSDQLGVSFSNYALLDEALTHASSVAMPGRAGSRDYEALEFLGDAVLDLAVSHYLYNQQPGRRPGDYTKLRAIVVNRDNVCRVAKRLNLAQYIRLGKGEEVGGGRRRAALLADCLEAVIGAVYLDSGWEKVLAFVLRIFSPELESLESMPPVWDYKSQLQIYCQGMRIELPRFEVVRSDGPDHRKEFEIEVIVNGQPLGRGVGRSKKEAEQQAAHQALLAIKQSGVESVLP